MTGMQEVSEKTGVPLIDLDRGDPAEITIPAGRLVKKIKVPALLKEMDFVISIPVMKTHMHTGVTLSIKNMKGLLWRKEKARFHHLGEDEHRAQDVKTLDVAISEMASVLFPHLAIIDGTVGMEGMGPAYGRAKKMGVVIVGENARLSRCGGDPPHGFGSRDSPTPWIVSGKRVGRDQAREDPCRTAGLLEMGESLCASSFRTLDPFS